MSHELRTPLNSVLGFSQVLETNSSNHLDDKELKYLKNIHKSGKHLLELINNILDISKVESGNMDYLPETVNLTEIIDDTIVLVEPMAKKKSIDLHSDINPENLEIHVDRLKFKEIMYNLLSNAIKFTPEKGKAYVHSKCVNENIHILVSDTGIGIPKEKFESIFDPFKQVDSSSNRKYGGTGLGLALVKKYVEMHGGEVWVESEVGKGSTFTFTIPIVGS
jgi:signal transduction histidine kinase